MIKRLLIANRGEVAVRVARAAADMGIASVATYSHDDRNCLHTKIADAAFPLQGVGASAYLDGHQFIAAALETGCDAIHPGYGFLSERPDFALSCEQAGIAFIGPSSETLSLLGSKTNSLALARKHGVPVIPGTAGPTSLNAARTFFVELPPGSSVLLKAISGGGGRGMRVIERIEQFKEAFEICTSEAKSAFGNGDLFVEKMISRARHIEVQVLGDGLEVSHLWDRDCSLQRKHQKCIEIAPSPALAPGLRAALIESATTLARACTLRSLATFEFLVDTASDQYYFIEANPRLQVEHTITEEITGVDLVQAQLRIASGESLDCLSLSQADIPAPTGYALQLRVNMETVHADGNVHSAHGRITIFEPPSGPGIRTDTFGYAGYEVSPLYDSLLAKIVVHSRSSELDDVIRRAGRALSQTRIQGVETNVEFLRAIISLPNAFGPQAYTRLVDDNLEWLAEASSASRPERFLDTTVDIPTVDESPIIEQSNLCTAITAEISGLVVHVAVVTNDLVKEGDLIAVVESMKMQHLLPAPCSGIIRKVFVAQDEAILAGSIIAHLEPADTSIGHEGPAQEVDLDLIRADLKEVIERHEVGLDENRGTHVAKRHALGKRTARENIEHLCDPGSFIEYGALTFAAQRDRYTEQELAIATPADGLVAGLATVNGQQYSPEKTRCLVLAYDYTVLAGTQGVMNHKKLSRMLNVAEQMTVPVILFAEGGGGRPGDNDDATRATGLNMPSFLQFARLSGMAPRISIVSGRCFAGNAVLAGSSDILIATLDANIGMAGPVMVEGAGLGIFRPEEIGPVDIQAHNGVIDCVVADESEAVTLTQTLLGFFQGTTSHWACQDQRQLRNSVPENRLQAYDMWPVIETLADTGSAVRLRERFAANMITALIRIEGQPVGVFANNPRYLGGAIDANASDKAARFLQLCDAFDLPVLSLCDTPGFMVGPETEKTAMTRHASRLFAVAANLDTPLLSLIIRKGYGLGAMAMTGGSFHAPLGIASWPSGEFGGMGFEGAVKLAYRNELEAIGDDQQRKRKFDALVNEYYHRGKASSVAASLEFDAVIDPSDSRWWLAQTLRSQTASAGPARKKRPFIDTW